MGVDVTPPMVDRDRIAIPGAMMALLTLIATSSKRKESALEMIALLHAQTLPQTTSATSSKRKMCALEMSALLNARTLQNLHLQHLHLQDLQLLIAHSVTTITQSDFTALQIASLPDLMALMALTALIRRPRIPATSALALIALLRANNRILINQKATTPCGLRWKTSSCCNMAT